MKSRPAELRRLLGTVKELELANLSRVAAEFDVISDRLNHLRGARSQHHNDTTTIGTIAPSTLSGADQKWGLWLEGEIRKTNAALALVAARKEQQIQQARIALGRVRAMDGVIRKLARRGGSTT
ncbi:MAG: hypothetical protein ACC619_06255 [Paracoccaceae bacterium]